jgi:hypothetical protein
MVIAELTQTAGSSAASIPVTSILLWTSFSLAYVILLAPLALYLTTGWAHRRSDFYDSFTEDAIKSYFHAFHPVLPQDPLKCKEQFKDYYMAQFGRSRFFWPAFLFAASALVLIFWEALSVADLITGIPIAPGKLPIMAVLATAGAVMWILYDAIKRWYALDITPADIYWWCFRLMIAVPMGYAMAAFVSAAMGNAVAFLLGVLPTGELLSLGRRLANRQFGGNNSESGQISELQTLCGVDARAAERFEAEAITTILQLAYVDPIRITIRTGFTYSYVVDCICQALLWIYVKSDGDKLRQSGLRSAYEVLDLYLDLNDEASKEKAGKVLAEAAAAIGSPPTSLANMLEQVALDPYTVFLYLSWSGTKIGDLTPDQKKLILGSGSQAT